MSAVETTVELAANMEVTTIADAVTTAVVTAQSDATDVAEDAADQAAAAELDGFSMDLTALAAKAQEDAVPMSSEDVEAELSGFSMDLTALAANSKAKAEMSMDDINSALGASKEALAAPAEAAGPVAPASPVAPSSPAAATSSSADEGEADHGRLDSVSKRHNLKLTNPFKKLLKKDPAANMVSFENDAFFMAKAVEASKPKNPDVEPLYFDQLSADEQAAYVAKMENQTGDEDAEVTITPEPAMESPTEATDTAAEAAAVPTAATPEAAPAAASGEDSKDTVTELPRTASTGAGRGYRRSASGKHLVLDQPSVGVLSYA